MWAFLLNPLHKERYSAFTDLAPSECLARINAHAANPNAVQTSWAVGPHERFPIWLVSLSSQHASIIKRLPNFGPIYIQNGYQIQASAKLTPTVTGTRVSIALSIRLVNAIIDAILMFGGIVGAAIGLAINIDAHNALIAIPLFMAWYYFIISLLRGLGLWYARKEPAWLLQFLKDTLETSAITRERPEQRASIA
jgi:hypothetical protein